MTSLKEIFCFVRENVRKSDFFDDKVIFEVNVKFYVDEYALASVQEKVDLFKYVRTFSEKYLKRVNTVIVVETVEENKKNSKEYLLNTTDLLFYLNSVCAEKMNDIVMDSLNRIKLLEEREVARNIENENATAMMTAEIKDLKEKLAELTRQPVKKVTKIVKFNDVVDDDRMLVELNSQRQELKEKPASLYRKRVKEVIEIDDDDDDDVCDNRMLTTYTREPFNVFDFTSGKIMVCFTDENIKLDVGWITLNSTLDLLFYHQPSLTIYSKHKEDYARVCCRNDFKKFLLSRCGTFRSSFFVSQVNKFIK